MVHANPCKLTLMHEPAKAFEIQLRPVRLWLLVAAAMIFLTLIVGGATRLTESGLSIVEWKPITGVMPPFSENEWRAEFGQIPDHSAIPGAQPRHEPEPRRSTGGMSHRLFSATDRCGLPRCHFSCSWRAAQFHQACASGCGTFAAGAALGGGWLVDGVPSGLTQGVSVSQYRLAFHLTLTTAIYGAIVWTAQQLGNAGAVRCPRACALPRRRSRFCCQFRFILARWWRDSMRVSSTTPGRRSMALFVPSAERLRGSLNRPGAIFSKIRSPYSFNTAWSLFHLVSGNIARLRCLARKRAFAHAASLPAR